MLIYFKTQYTETGISVVNLKDIFGRIDEQIRFVRLLLNIKDKKVKDVENEKRGLQP